MCLKYGFRACFGGRGGVWPSFPERCRLELRRAGPLLILAVFGLVAGYAVANWYWTSQPIMMTVHVPDGIDIVAKANINPLLSWNGMSKVAFADLVESNGFFDGSEVDLEPGTKYVFVRVGETNAGRFFTRVNASYPAGMAVSCTVAIVDRRDIGEYPTVAHWHDLGLIALDGSQSLELKANGDPLYLVSEPVEHMRYAMYAFTVSPGTLPPGDHVLTVQVHLGDTP